jgi:hypothetical protein
LFLTLAKPFSNDLIISYFGSRTISILLFIKPILSPCLINATPSSKLYNFSVIGGV